MIYHERIFGWLAGVILLAANAWGDTNAVVKPPPEHAGYVGSASCRECHAQACQIWAKSHHAEAERLVQTNLDRAAFVPTRELGQGTQRSVFQWQDGQPRVAAFGLSGRWETNVVARVIGEDPLRQFLVGFPGGRWQVLETAYDPRSNEWFNIFGNENREPGEWGHWTGQGMNWNSMCAACHNTAVRKNYDAATDSYHTTMAERTVSCEACHGPLQAHVDWQRQYGRTSTNDPAMPRLSREQELDMCASCHARRADLTGEFRPGDKFMDHFEPATVDAGDEFYPDGQVHDEDYEYSAFLGSRMHQAGLTCLDCHPRSLHMARLHGNELCLQCHKGGFPKAPVIDPLAHSHHAAGSPGNECAGCHMPQTVYMQRHWRHDHGFTIPDPLLTKEFGVPNACNRCHADQNTDWALKQVDAWYGAKMLRHSRDRAEIIARARNGEPPARTNLVRLLDTEEIPYWRAVAAGLLGSWAGDPEVGRALVRGLEDTNALVRGACVRALAPLAEDESVARALQLRLADASRNVRLAAALDLSANLPENSPATADLKRYLAFNADQPQGQLELGMYYFARGNADTARAHLQTAVAWDGHSTPLRLELATVLSAQGRTQEALEQLQTACRETPRDAPAHFSLGLAWNEAGNAVAARQELETAVRLDPRFAQAWYNLGLLQNAAGQADEAVNSLLRAEEADPTDARAPYARATILAHLNRTEDAKAAVRRALELRPGDTDARRLLGILTQGPPAER
jgi:tetratricopeptide (TPR) repeat protein